MSNQYPIPPPVFPDDASSGLPPPLPTGLPGFSLRRTSYASVASGAAGYGRSGATFQQLLNSSGADAAAADGSNGSASRTQNGNGGASNGAGGRLSYAGIGGSSSVAANNGATGAITDAAEALRAGSGGADMTDGTLLRWLGGGGGGRDTPMHLPSFSRAFEPFLRGPPHAGAGFGGGGAAASGYGGGFFTPSYLRGSVYVQRLEDQYHAKMQALRASQQSQPFSRQAAEASAAAAAGAGGAGLGLSHLGGTRAGAANQRKVAGGGSVAAGPGGSAPTTGAGRAYDAGDKVGLSSSSSSSAAVPALGAGVAGAGGLLDPEEAIAPLPSRWDKGDKASALDVLADGLEVKYTAAKSANDRDQEVSSVRSDHYMPPQCGIYYFEVTILSKKREESTIGIGFSDASAMLSRPPGWEPKSWGYHSDDGNIFSDHGPPKHYGPSFGSGDTVGCGVNFRTGTAFYTKNGTYLDIAFRDIKGSNLKLFPTVGLKKTGEHVRVNFGQVPFTFDIDGLMKNERAAIKRRIAETSTESLAPPLGETDLIQQLVLQFLQHDGYVETARAFAEEIHTEKVALNLDPTQEIEGISIVDDEDANRRQHIRRAVLEGDVDRALELTEEGYPGVLAKYERVAFRLKCRKFVEMIREEAELNLMDDNDHGDGTGSHSRLRSQRPPAQQSMDVDDIDMVEDGTDEGPRSQSLAQQAIEYGQALQVEYASDPREEYRFALDAIFGLLAYPNPLKVKEVAHLLDQRGRVAVAEELNSAILESLGKSSRAALENVYAQTSVLLEDLRQDGGPGSFITVQDVVEDVPPSDSV